MTSVARENRRKLVGYVLIFTKTNGKTCHGLMCNKSKVPSVFISGNVTCMYVHSTALCISRVKSTDWGVTNFFQDKTLMTKILYYKECWPRLCQIKTLILSLFHEHTQLDSTKITVFRDAQSHSWHPDDRASWCILVLKPTRCTNFSNLFLE